MPEFRWILLVLGAVLLGGIWWWGDRRPTRARGQPEVRESEIIASTGSAVSSSEPSMPSMAASSSGFTANPITREPSISPYEPLRISARDPQVTENAVDLPIMFEPAVDHQVAQIEEERLREGESAEAAESLEALASFPAESSVPEPPAEPAAAPVPVFPAPEDPPQAQAPPAVSMPAQAEPAASTSAAESSTSNTGRFRHTREPLVAPRTDISGRFSRVKPPVTAPPMELQKIITVRVCAVADAPWDGSVLATALAASDLIHGRYGIFHRLHADGRSVFCVASLVEPGSFVPARMQEQTFPGVSMFAVLPGPVEPLRTLDDLLAVARQLAIDLSGVVQDDEGIAMSPQRIGTLRDEVIRFHLSLQEQPPA